MKTIQLISKKVTFIAFSIVLFIYQQEIKAQTEDSQTSIIGKVLCGYQGWFNTQGDGSDTGWKHYRTGSGKFEPGHVTIDFWPDMSEADADEKYDTPFTYKDGTTATLFTSANSKTVNRHFKWMNDYNIDGVFVQRFSANLKANTQKLKNNNNVVFDNTVAGAIANNRLVSIMYDMSGSSTETVVEDIKRDWKELVAKHGVNNPTNKHFLSYKSKPIVALWGVGFVGGKRDYSLEDIEKLINFFKNDPVYGGCTVLLGVPTFWRTKSNDAVSGERGEKLHQLIKSADIVHPWTVTRYRNLNDLNINRTRLAQDKAWCDEKNLLYMPVVYAGFSVQNNKRALNEIDPKQNIPVLNEIPRLKGNFLWKMFHNAVDEGAKTIYVAMFDEMDEGTCIFKVDGNPPSSATSQFTNYEGLPSDYYLWLTGKAGEMLRNEITLTSAQPAYPNLSLPNNYYVIADGDDGNTGTSLGTAFKTVQNAHNNASSGNKIFISGNVVHNSTTQITKDITLEGLSNGTLSPNQNRNGFARMFDISTDNLTVSFKDLAFSENTGTTAAGSVFNISGNSDVTFTNVTFQGNSSTLNGGAVYATNGNLTFLNTTFYNNSSGNADNNGAGGGLFISGPSAVANITNSSFFQNKITRTDPNFGAAIRAENEATANVTNSLIWNNKAENGSGNESGFNATENSVTTGAKSLFGYFNNFGPSNMAFTNTIDLASSNLIYNTSLRKVIFTAPDAIIDDTPIDFGNDTSDVGAWDSNINIFIANTSNVWDLAANWSNGALPLPADNVAIVSGAEVTLDTDATIVDLKLKDNLSINSGQSLIVTGTVSGDSDKVYYRRTLTFAAGDAEGWHLVAAPVSGETYDNNFLTDNDIASGSENNRGIASYVTSDDSWDYMQANESNTFSSGLGYSMKKASTGQVKFIGDLNTDDLGVTATVSTIGNGFNLLGNPYTAFINSKTFLTENTNLEQQIWVWDQTGGGNYLAKIAGDDFEVAPGQGFFVKAISGTSVNFAEDNQSTQTSDTFLRTSSIKEIKLLMTDGQKTRFAKIYFTDTATTSFDSGWDGEVFGGVAHSLNVYTNLLEDNQGKKYQVQSLPISEIESIVIPVGVIAAAGKELTFSLEQTNFPTDVKVYLEDRIANTFNELTDSKTFKVTLSEALNDVGRFYMHASKSALNIDDNIVLENSSIYKSNATTLKIVGLPNGNATIKLFDTLGKQVLNTSFKSVGVKEITVPKLATGVYIVHLETETSKLNKKIIFE